MCRIYICLDRYMCICVQRSDKEVGSPICHAQPYSLETGSLGELTARLVSSKLQQSSCFCPKSVRVTGKHDHT